jgi:hypothetical protein
MMRPADAAAVARWLVCECELLRDVAQALASLLHELLSEEALKGIVIEQGHVVRDQASLCGVGLSGFTPAHVFEARFFVFELLKNADRAPGRILKKKELGMHDA